MATTMGDRYLFDDLRSQYAWLSRELSLLFEQYAFTVESDALFEEWDEFLETQVSKAKSAIMRQKNVYERTKVGVTPSVWYISDRILLRCFRFPRTWLYFLSTQSYGNISMARSSWVSLKPPEPQKDFCLILSAQPPNRC